jgi:hypothetical protein
MVEVACDRLGGALVRFERLPKFYAISFGVGDLAELSEVIGFAFGIDRDAFADQAVQNGIMISRRRVMRRPSQIPKAAKRIATSAP